jgi:hypothetical protein
MHSPQELKQAQLSVLLRQNPHSVVPLKRLLVLVLGLFANWKQGELRMLPPQNPHLLVPLKPLHHSSQLRDDSL